MSPLLIDCSVTMAWCFESETTDYTEAALDVTARDSAVAPTLWALEVTNVLAGSVRRGVLSAAKGERFRAVLERLRIALEPITRERALGPVRELAEAHRLTSYDAVYLELAKRTGLRLASLDADLCRAAAAEQVELFRPR